MEIINSVLSEEKAKKDSIKVDTLITPECFFQQLLVVDNNQLQLQFGGTEERNREEFLSQHTRSCIQYLTNKLTTSFPLQSKDGFNFYKITSSQLPQQYNLPREKPIPVAKPMTKWETFAKEKGIGQFRGGGSKRAKSTWDDILQTWVPRYGYKKVAAEKQKEWLIEVPENVHPQTDMFAERKKVKKENIAKNEYQRLRNIASARKMKVPNFGLAPPLEGNMHHSQLKVAADIARVSTASLGKFQPKLLKEKSMVLTTKQKKPNKRAFKSIEEEKRVNLQIAESVLRKSKSLKQLNDMTKAENTNTTRQKQKQKQKQKTKNVNRKK